MKKIIIILISVSFLVVCYKFTLNKEVKNIGDEEYIKIDIEEEFKEYNNAEVENYEYIKLGDSENSVIEKIGNPVRKNISEYGFIWYVYNQDYSKFAMVGIKDDCVVSLFSNSINSCETESIKLNDSKDNIKNEFESLEYLLKGNTRYIINSNGEYDVVKENKKYITFFYDVIEGNKVCSYQIISEEIEDNMKDVYSTGSEDLRKSFELITIDLINSTRAKYNLSPMSYSEKATISSRKHSQDMKVKKYFDHTNKNGETPFDRMKKEKISYISAAENIASGQFSSIYAHEALMNSEGHRKNILGDYKYIGVGVDFGGEYKIYYTQNFYSY